MGLFDRLFEKKEAGIFKQIADLLSGKGINFRREGEYGEVFLFDANVDERVIRCMLVTNLERNLLTFSAFLPYQIPTNKVVDCFELIIRLNEKIWYG
jgi:hypothetical protein